MELPPGQTNNVASTNLKNDTGGRGCLMVAVLAAAFVLGCVFLFIVATQYSRPAVEWAYAYVTSAVTGTITWITLAWRRVGHPHIRRLVIFVGLCTPAVACAALVTNASTAHVLPWLYGAGVGSLSAVATHVVTGRTSRPDGGTWLRAREMAVLMVVLVGIVTFGLAEASIGFEAGQYHAQARTAMQRVHKGMSPQKVRSGMDGAWCVNGGLTWTAGLQPGWAEVYFFGAHDPDKAGIIVVQYVAKEPTSLPRDWDKRAFGAPSNDLFVVAGANEWEYDSSSRTTCQGPPTDY